jgi:hypothetical protein
MNAATFLLAILTKVSAGADVHSPQKKEIHRQVTSTMIATRFFYCYSSGTLVNLESVFLLLTDR